VGLRDFSAKDGTEVSAKILKKYPWIPHISPQHTSYTLSRLGKKHMYSFFEMKKSPCQKKGISGKN